MCINLCVHTSGDKCVCVCICPCECVKRTVAQGDTGATPPPPSIEKWLQEGAFGHQGLPFRPCHPGGFCLSYWTQELGEGNEMQILEWAGGLYLDFLGLSGEICFFLVVLSWEGDVQVPLPLKNNNNKKTKSKTNKTRSVPGMTVTH